MSNEALSQAIDELRRVVAETSSSSVEAELNQAIADGEVTGVEMLVGLAATAIAHAGAVAAASLAVAEEVLARLPQEPVS